MVATASLSAGLAPLARVFTARSLAQAGAALAAVPPRLLLPGHSLTVVSWFADEPLAGNFMASYWLALLAAFGGGILTALLIQDPSSAPIALFADNAVGVAFTAAWWAYLYAPPLVRAPVRAAMANPAARAAARACTNALRAGLVASRVDLAVRKFPGVWAAPLLLGTIGGAGGKLLTDPLARAARGGASARGTHPPTEFAVPGLALRSAAAGAALQWVLVHVAALLTPAEGLALLTALFVGHGLATDGAAALLAGPARPLDYTAAPAAALHWAAGVPMPGGSGSGSRGSAPRGRSRAKKAA